MIHSGSALTVVICREMRKTVICSMKKPHISQLLLMAAGLWAILGTFSWVSPGNTADTVVRYSGFALLANGIFLLVASYTGGGTREQKRWTRAESILDLLFCAVLLLDPVFAQFAFPFLITPWLASKGLLKMIASLAMSRRLLGWNGDFIAGTLLIVLSLSIPHHPEDNPVGIAMLLGAIGWILALDYVYDSLKPIYVRK